MSERHEHIDEISGTKTTGHEWDGIRELNTPLPRWWLITFYACIAFAVVYVFFMPAIPGLPGAAGATKGIWNASDRADVDVAISKLKTERASNSARLVSASLKQIETDQDLQDFARAAGASAFGDNCATCHGSGGAGAKGYPSLADDKWIWGGSLDDIRQTIRFGIRSGDDQQRFSEMPAFGRDELLEAPQIADVTEYVYSLTHKDAVATRAARGALVFEANCAACHGADARGMRELGAPNLTDNDWLYGGSRKEIRQQVELARGGVMPAWHTRLDEATIKALAVYVHSLGGGE